MAKILYVTALILGVSMTISASVATASGRECSQLFEWNGSPRTISRPSLQARRMYNYAVLASRIFDASTDVVIRSFAPGYNVNRTLALKIAEDIVRNSIPDRDARRLWLASAESTTTMYSRSGEVILFFPENTVLVIEDGFVIGKVEFFGNEVQFIEIK